MNLLAKKGVTNVTRREEGFPEQLRDVIVSALQNVKAEDITVLDVRSMTPLTDYMVIASGTSDRHLRTMKDTVLHDAAAMGAKPLGVEGDRGNDAEWILIDLSDCIVHLMRPRVRAFYNLERLWSVAPEPADASLQGNAQEI